jgi:large subunit ribosomal protein L25
MEQRELEVILRTGTGKGVAHRIRREGKIPAVLYGRKMGTFHLALKPEELKKILSSGARENTLIGLKVSGPGSDQIGKQVVMLKDLQVHPISQSYLHADFYAVAMDVKIEVEIPIRLTGKPEGTKVGGILGQALRELRVRCLPSDIPEFVELDVSALKIGDSLHARDIPQSDRYEIVTDADITLASVTPPISEAKFEEMVAAPVVAGEIAQPERIGEKKEEAVEGEEAKEAKGAKEAKEPKEAKGAKESKEPKEAKETKETKETKDSKK